MQILVGYIPTTSLEGITNKAARRRAVANLFHACMRNVLAPISSCGEDGIPMMSADGVWRRCHPILAAFVGDYPEQALVTCTYSGRCPKCQVPHDQLGEHREFPSRRVSDAIDTYRLADGSGRLFHRACREAGLKPIFHPFWESLPFSDIFLSITPDILHQLLQGVMKHLIAWVTSPTVFGPVEINARCRSLPPNHSTTLFVKGITTLSRVSGQEHKNMCRILLGLVINLRLPGGLVSARVVKAVRALLDFLYLAQYPTHTSDTLCCLQESLMLFHDNKQVFVDLGTRENFMIPKLHSLLHYRSSIMLFGTTDNYNTEQTERLHIDFAKDAYHATNCKDEYFQMTAWLERREKIQRHAALIERRQQGGRPRTDMDTRIPVGPPHPEAPIGILKMAQFPTINVVSWNDLHAKYGAIQFQDALADFVAQINNPNTFGRALCNQGANTLLPFRAVPVFHRIRFVSSNGDRLDTVDAILARPEHLALRGQIIPSRFDTVLVRRITRLNKGESIRIES